MNVPVKAHEGIIDYSKRAFVPPAVGEVTVQEVSVHKCKVCGCAVDETSLCSFKCPNDGSHEKGKTYHTVVYEQTNKVLRVE